MEDFYELELNVKGLKSLDESLDDYLTVEELNGDNQYFLITHEFSQERNYVSSYMLFLSLGKLHASDFISSMFSSFDTTTKKKVTSPFSFPAELSMHHRLSVPSQSELIYDLSAVLIHKGIAANSGHYIAHIKDENTGQWWEFDDEVVTNLGHSPFFEEASSSTSKSAKNSQAPLPIIKDLDQHFSY
ncbi:ubiquitin carboxyl-terminal hydrolase 26-like protein [Trifolium pratense]|uniref:ubiquitinyl hydrolase 1 n=1 Tax=Trifolium pratense TaxID=57577 RepID=A0A2K3NJ14_TRIPR|nr:ubiquitin carboxyl-terminal hydrolase 26-like protein [Trifolium pratense]